MGGDDNEHENTSVGARVRRHHRVRLAGELDDRVPDPGRGRRPPPDRHDAAVAGRDGRGLGTRAGPAVYAGFGRIVASEIEAPNMLVNMV